MMKNFDSFRNKIIPVLAPYGIERVALFGSIVRGEETPESDIDILVEFQEPRKKTLSLFGWIELEEKLEKLLGRRIDLVSAKALKPRIRPTVEKEMVILYEKQKRSRTPRRYSGRHRTHRVSPAQRK